MFTKDMPHHDVTLLNAGRIGTWHIQQHIAQFKEFSSRFAR